MAPARLIAVRPETFRHPQRFAGVGRISRTGTAFPAPPHWHARAPGLPMVANPVAILAKRSFHVCFTAQVIEPAVVSNEIATKSIRGRQAALMQTRHSPPSRRNRPVRLIIWRLGHRVKQSNRRCPHYCHTTGSTCRTLCWLLYSRLALRMFRTDKRTKFGSVRNKGARQMNHVGTPSRGLNPGGNQPCGA